MIGRRLLCRLALAAPILVLGGAARADFDQAMAYFRAGKYLEAAAQFQGMVDVTPTYDYGHYMLGNCLLRTGRPEDAERSFRRAIELRTDKAEYRHGFAVALKDQRRYGMALSALWFETRMLRDRRIAYAFHSLRGYLLAAMRRWPEAVLELEQAVAIKRDPTLQDLLGRAYFAVGRYDRSAAAFSAALSGAPTDPRPCRMLAEALIQLAAAVPDPPRKKVLYRQAMAAAERLQRLQPGDPDAAGLLGRAALGAGEYAVAEQALKAALAAHPGACPTLVNLSRALLALDRIRDAEDALNGAARCAPTMPEVHEGLGRVYVKQSRFEMALAAFRRANDIQPSPTSRAGMALARSKLGGSAD